MQQIAISEGPVDLKIVFQGLLCINRASLLHLLDIFWYLVWLLIILSDKFNLNRGVAMGKQPVAKEFSDIKF